ncbi:MAG: quinolinate synthase [Acidobacteria bacterium RIFCSPLOWO2_12_FULL_54_10]|nr:MAG: quinolinate synthase [Acidobacteria bacterium RIFCSPLOWO2_12_FULL_54_10]
MATAVSSAQSLTAEKILQLKRQKNAVILAHNYQLPEVQEIADFVGDSLGLSQEAARTQCERIVFCGVHFMAETASILCPQKKVLLPDLEAGCSLADTVNAEQLRAWKAKNPGAVVVTYVNTTAEVKAESDYCCTSSNAVKVVNAVPADKEILFLPDMYLGAYVQEITGRKLNLWMGECHVHAGIRPNQIADMQRQHPKSELLVHPECGCTTSFLYYHAAGDVPGTMHFCSTEGMVRYAKQSPANEFIVATETGILDRMRKQAPEKKFYPASEDAVCRFMKKITIEKVLHSLEEDVYEIKVSPEIAAKARLAIERMLQLA